MPKQTPKPPDPHLGEFHRLLDAREEAITLLRKRKEMPLSELDRIAEKHSVSPVLLLSQVSLYSDCAPDLSAGVLRCRKA